MPPQEQHVLTVVERREAILNDILDVLSPIPSATLPYDSDAFPLDEWMCCVVLEDLENHTRVERHHPRADFMRELPIVRTLAFQADSRDGFCGVHHFWKRRGRAEKFGEDSLCTDRFVLRLHGVERAQHK